MNFIKFVLLVSPVAIWLYAMFLSVTLFLIPAFGLYFATYGVLGTFGMLAGLNITGFICGFWFMKVLTH